MDTKEKLKEIISSNDVCLFMKGVPDAPQCGFSMAISNILKHLNVNFKGINVLEDENIRQGIKEYSDWPTIPQLYIKGEFVGGCDIVKELFENGELKTMLQKKLSSYFLLKNLLNFLVKYFLIKDKKFILFSDFNSSSSFSI